MTPSELTPKGLNQKGIQSWPVSSRGGVVIFLLTLPIRLALRHRPPAVVVVVQIPAQAPMTLEQEWERIQAHLRGASADVAVGT
jgi:hypothetical protein